MDATSLLGHARIIPVVVLNDVDLAVPLAETLLASGLDVMEVTLRTEHALECMAAIAAAVPEMLLGAGSVRERDQLIQVRDAGVRFAVSPGHSNNLAVAAMDHAMPFVPGAVTASEVIALQEWGYELIKFFPAELAGGIPMIKALSGPLPDARFMPTGGIDADKAKEYLALPQVSGVGGSWITPSQLLADRDLDGIARLAKEAASF